MAEQNLTPPVPKKVEHRREHHGDVFIDPTNGSATRKAKRSSTTSRQKPNTPKLSPQTSSPSANPSSTKSRTAPSCRI